MSDEEIKELQAYNADLLRQRNVLATNVTLLSELLKGYARDHCGGKPRSEGKVCPRCKQTTELMSGRGFAK